MDTESVDLESIREHVRIIFHDDLVKLREDFFMNSLHCCCVVLGVGDEVGEIVKDREDGGEIITLMEFFDHIFEEITESVSEIRARVIHNLDNIEKSLKDIRTEISSGFNISVEVLEDVLELRVHVILVIEEVGRSENIQTVSDSNKAFNGIINGHFEGFVGRFDNIREILDDFQKFALINIVSEEKDVSDEMGDMEKVQIVNIEVLWEMGVREVRRERKIRHRFGIIQRVLRGLAQQLQHRNMCRSPKEAKVR